MITSFSMLLNIVFKKVIWYLLAMPAEVRGSLKSQRCYEIPVEIVGEL